MSSPVKMDQPTVLEGRQTSSGIDTCPSRTFGSFFLSNHEPTGRIRGCVGTRGYRAYRFSDRREEFVVLSVDSPRATAWTPWRRDREWLLRREALAAGWLLEQAKEEGGKVVVQGMSHAHHYRDGDGPIAKVARLGEVATFRSPVRSGPVIVPDPGIRLLATAVVNAGGHSVVATESPTFPLLGWAMATGALNLETGESTEDARTSS